ncbi:MAG: hypothetical protein EOP48_09315 [Sphingobacteriales bacterium]|nr:MAG: hypothetical protein EOP48_09315 [Sphingobacteriales bacterium]
MKMRWITFYIVSILTLTAACNDDREVNSLISRSILNGQIIGKTKIGRGDFHLVIRDSIGLDTIPIYRHATLYYKIDSLTTISKEVNNSMLIFRDLKNESLRYSDTIYLNEYNSPQKVE